MSTIENAKREIADFARKEVDLAQRKRAAEATAASIENAAGQAVADGAKDLEAAIEKASRAQTESRMLAAAIAATHQRRTEAIQRLRDAIRAEREAKLAELAAEGQKIASKVEDHRRAIAELYQHDIAIQVVGGGFGANYTTLQRLQLNSEGLSNEIVRLSGPIPADGRVDLEDGTAGPAEVAITVLSSDRLTPTAEVIFAWFAACEKNAGQAFGDHQRRVYVLWRDGTIDEDSSYVLVDDFVLPSGERSSFTDKPFSSIESATFYSNRPPKRVLTMPELPEQPAPDPAVRRVSVAQLLGHEARLNYPMIQPENPDVA